MSETYHVPECSQSISFHKINIIFDMQIPFKFLSDIQKTCNKFQKPPGTNEEIHNMTVINKTCTPFPSRKEKFMTGKTTDKNL